LNANRTHLSGIAGRLVHTGFRGLAALRGARAFHPDGLLLKGERRALSRADLRWPEQPVPFMARMSTGAGLPGRLPDALGLAVRIPAGEGEKPWDLTLTTSWSGFAGRVLPRPERDWTTGRYSTLLPYRRDDDLFWLVARTEETRRAEASLSALRRLIAEGPMRFTLEAVSTDGIRRPCATLTLQEVAEDAARPAFDPMVNHPVGCELRPGWLTRLRESAYRGSRAGRTDTV
jgi:hypothetical protein